MQSPHGITRVILVCLDGLRSDAVPLLPLPHIRALAACGATTFRGTTVEPSITAAALASVFTGVPPSVHGIQSDRFGLPRPTEPLITLPRLLNDHGLPTFGHLAALPRYFRGLGPRIAAQIGAAVRFEGVGASDILDHARGTLDRERCGLIFLHWPDADVAGHADGWMSPRYAAAARRLDDSLDRLVRSTGVLDDPATVLIAFADHGGGGLLARDHNSRHLLDVTIPIIVVGRQIARTDLAPGASLLDIPATIARLLGIKTPANYAGRTLSESIARAPHTSMPWIGAVAMPDSEAA